MTKDRPTASAFHRTNQLRIDHCRVLVFVSEQFLNDPVDEDAR